ncbi:aminoglycoside adenylyltransferase domain-containing protein [Rhodococcus qingshengii]|uniref:aminoglycoside adenylyltransferase domain-containing protein n=1 Tax=Rhodococcus qingshengii TaxID=334542 RepID=UPI0036DEF07E
MDKLLAPILAHIDRHNPGDVVGVYLYGSAVSTGLRPDSDVDVLAVTRRSLTRIERASLVDLLLGISGWRGHLERFPDAAGRRPLEVTFLALDDLEPMTARPRRDFQYGEWLREELSAGALPEPADDPDVVILLATAHQSSRTLRGHAFGSVVAPVPSHLLRRAVVERVPDLVSEVCGDERNVLLTLARILVTLETGEIVSKDVAAQTVAADRTGPERALLLAARAGYLGLVRDDWSEWRAQAHALVTTLANEIVQQDGTLVPARNLSDMP